MRLARSSAPAQAASARQARRAALPLRSARGALHVRAFKEASTPARTSIEDAVQRQIDSTPPTAMFCYQCEQTLDNKGCTSAGVCGKSPEVAGLQDLLIYSVKGLSCLAHAARQGGIEDATVNQFINAAVFSTLTNVNFDDMRFFEWIDESVQLHDKLTTEMKAKHIALPEFPSHEWFVTMPHPAVWNAQQAASAQDGHVALSAGELMDLSRETSIAVRKPLLGDTLVGLQELLVYGLKGLCAYAHHAEAMGFNNPKVYAFVQEAMTFLCTKESEQVSVVLDMCFKAGECNFTVMQMLSEAHSTRYGHPVPTPVSLAPVPGKALLVTGHDMHDMELVLAQTVGKGINVYTHGEMLPAHGYPGLKEKYPHLMAHYGGAWYRQKSDFASFPGAVLVTTNCVLEPLQVYRNNLFTANECGISGVAHVASPDGPAGGKDFSKVIARSLELPGFTKEKCDSWPNQKTVTVGFGHNAVLASAPQIIDAINTGKLQHIFLIGGCDGSEPQRKYYSGLAHVMPPETMVLTLGCGKFRIFDQDFGMLADTGLPRLLDMGQCNDAYSALVVATELAKAFKTDINSLPLSLDLSWFEQKAVAVLLTLLHLGVRNIRLGPRLPAFLTADAVNVLVERFNLIPADTANPDKDLKAMMSLK